MQLVIILCVLLINFNSVCTHDLSLVHVVSAGVPISPYVEVWQSGHGALEVVLLNMAEVVVATSQDNSVFHLYRTRVPANVMIMDPSTRQ